MNRVMKFSVVFLITIFLISYVDIYANPIPVPTIIMPEEHVKIMFSVMNGEYYAIVGGAYPFKNIGYKNVTMYYPVPPNISRITVFIDRKPVKWSYVNKTYPTVIGNYSMISWIVENPPENFTVDVIYMQRLIRRSDGSFVFLYALGTGKYLNYYAKQTTAYIDVSSQFPVDKYQVYFDNKLNKSIELGKPIQDKMVVKSQMFKPLTKDFLVVFKPLNQPVLNAELSTDKPVYDVGESVKIMFINNGGSSVYLPNSAPWEIRNSKESIIYAPTVSQVVTEVKPGEMKIWTWDQRDYNGNQAPPDVYIILLHIMNPKTTLQYKFEIIHAMPPMPKPKFNGTLYIKVYPDRVKLDLNGTVELPKNYNKSTVPGNITVKAYLNTVDNITKSRFLFYLKLPRKMLEKIPVEYADAHYNYLNGHGYGNFTAVFNASKETPLYNASGVINVFYNKTSSISDLNITFSMYSALDYMNSHQIDQIESMVTMLNTPMFQDRIKNMIYEKSNESVELEYFNITFNRENGLLNGSVELRIWNKKFSVVFPILAKNIARSYIPPGNTPENMEFPKIPTYIETISSNFSLIFSKESGELRIIGSGLQKGNISRQFDIVKNILINNYLNKMYGLNRSSADIVSGFKNMYVDISNAHYLIEYPVNGKLFIEAGNIYVVYKQDPSKTYGNIRGMLKLIGKKIPKGLKIVIEGGSTEDKDVILSGGVKKFTASNITELPMIKITVNKYRIADYKLVSKKVTLNGKNIVLNIVANSTINEIKPIGNNGFSIVVSGLKGTVGALNITIPKPEGVSKDDVKVFIDGKTVNAVITGNSTVFHIYITYHHSTHNIEVKWSRQQPYITSYPYTFYSIIAIVIIIAVAIGTWIYKRR